MLSSKGQNLVLAIMSIILHFSTEVRKINTEKHTAVGREVCLEKAEQPWITVKIMGYLRLFVEPFTLRFAQTLTTTLVFK